MAVLQRSMQSRTEISARSKSQGPTLPWASQVPGCPFRTRRTPSGAGQHSLVLASTCALSRDWLGPPVFIHSMRYMSIRAKSSNANINGAHAVSKCAELHTAATLSWSATLASPEPSLVPCAGCRKRIYHQDKLTSSHCATLYNDRFQLHTMQPKLPQNALGNSSTTSEANSDKEENAHSYCQRYRAAKLCMQVLPDLLELSGTLAPKPHFVTSRTHGPLSK